MEEILQMSALELCKTDPARLRQCKRSSGSLQKTDTEVRVPGTCLCFHG